MFNLTVYLTNLWQIILNENCFYTKCFSVYKESQLGPLEQHWNSLNFIIRTKNIFQNTFYRREVLQFLKYIRESKFHFWVKGSRMPFTFLSIFQCNGNGYFRGLDPINCWCFSHVFVNAFCESSWLSHKPSGVLQSHIAISPSGTQRAPTSLKMHQRETKDLLSIWANRRSKPFPHSAKNPGKELCSGLKNNNDTFGKIWQAQQLFPCPKSVMCRNAVEAAMTYNKHWRKRSSHRKGSHLLCNFYAAKPKNITFLGWTDWDFTVPVC